MIDRLRDIPLLSLTMVSVIYLTRNAVTAGDCGGAAKLEGGDMSDGKKK